MADNGRARDNGTAGFAVAVGFGAIARTWGCRGIARVLDVRNSMAVAMLRVIPWLVLPEIGNRVRVLAPISVLRIVKG